MTAHSAEDVQVDYDLDPAAIDWARSKVQWAIDRADNFANQGGSCSEEWWRMARFLDTWLLGTGEGCVITPLDTRLPAVKRTSPGKDSE